MVRHGSHFPVLGPRCRVRALLAATLCFLAVQTPAQESLPGRDVESIRAWVLEHNPELRALAVEAEAAQARIVPAGALPEPTAGIALRGLDPGQPWRSAEMGRDITYSVRQQFPLWGKRELARSGARQAANASEFDRDAASRDLLAAAESAYVRYWHADQGMAVLDRRIALLHQIEEIAGVRYALGTAPQQDAIRAQVEQTVMQRERIERQAVKREAIATLNAVLGRPSGAPLADPDATPMLPVSAAAQPESPQYADHPAVLAQQARADAASANAVLQHRDRLPDVTLGIGAMQAGGGLESLEFMLEVEIPLQWRARREREREARLLEDAAQLRMEVTRRALEARGATARAQWTSARERRQLTE
jgi:outer membrane protein TolC